MTQTIADLINALKAKKVLLDEMCRLLEEEQQCVAALDMSRLETNHGELDQAMTRMETLNKACQALLLKSGAELGLEGNGSLSPVIARAKAPDRDILHGLQANLLNTSSALDNLLSVNRDILQDSLGLVDRSLTFFNRLFNNPTTYGEAGRMVTNSAGVRLVCKEI